MIEDEPIVRLVARALLEGGGYQVDTPDVERSAAAANAEEAALSGVYDLLLLDLRLPHTDPFSLLERLSSAKAAPEVIVVAGFLSPDLSDRLRLLGVAHFVEKPFTFSTLLAAVEAATTTTRRVSSPPP